MSSMGRTPTGIHAWMSIHVVPWGLPPMASTLGCYLNSRWLGVPHSILPIVYMYYQNLHYIWGLVVNCHKGLGSSLFVLNKAEYGKQKFREKRELVGGKEFITVADPLLEGRYPEQGFRLVPSSFSHS
ncbi:hypothetical protein C5167_044371 [Papaver somniferum]|uniref:Uncharacterized protein n=1 Tax=Papaver somniferum TaxID=3469 RepID=A0A4Y7LAU2_PAPSO|nr:hypothetical protein C5167_044371 [Papaver somniferum]